MKSPIIDIPSLQSLKQRFGYSVLTFLFWVLWIYLWLPLVSLFAWWVGVDLFYQEMIVKGGSQAVVQMVVWFSLVVLLSGVTFLGWAAYNLFRFRNKNRRKAIEAVKMADMAKVFNVSVKQLSKYHHTKCLVIHHDKHGKIEHIGQQIPSPPKMRAV